MKLICRLKNGNDTHKSLVLLESNDLEDLKSRAIEYASTNPSFRHGWKSSQDAQGQELAIDLDYQLEIRP